MRQKPVVVVGSANVDMVVKTGRFPRPGETVTGESFYTSFGGKGANQAVTAARLGAPVRFVGCVGDDSFGREMIANMLDEGVDTSHVSAAWCPRIKGRFFHN
jgi:ribokinase